MLYSIYKITNRVNGKCYIGFTQDVARRFKQHISNSKKDAPDSQIARALKKYGTDNFSFEVVYQTKDREHALLEVEPKLIEEYNSFTNGYNANEGGHNTNTEEMRLANSERMKIDNPSFKKLNSGVFKKGNVPIITEERNRKISLSKLGKNNPNYGKIGCADQLNKLDHTCPHCGVTTNKGNAKRWHFDNCKTKQ